MSAVLVERYVAVRNQSEKICSGLSAEDYVVQPIVDVSPPKWHLGHTTWFFETFVLQPFFKGYTVFNDQYNFVFNSYYETVGARVIRTDRGNLSRPSVEDVYRYRRFVDEHMQLLLSDHALDAAVVELIVLGLNHEQQHQELLVTDIKYILGHNPLFPRLDMSGGLSGTLPRASSGEYVSMPAGVYEIGFVGEGFSFDNEHGVHKVYLDDYAICSSLVSNGDYLEFIQDGGYSDFRHWHAEGWEWVKRTGATSPLYWHWIEGAWMYYTFDGLVPVEPGAPVCHVNFYEASAFAAWKGKRLATEAEWEVASDRFEWGQCWEWTGSAYLPYPRFRKAPGAIGEYNGKFMVNQMVLRGASVATPVGHSRKTYRNFFHAPHQWQISGIRLAQ